MTQSILVHASTWPASKLGRALSVLVQRVRLVEAPVEMGEPNAATDAEVQSWLDETSVRLGIEIVSVTNRCSDLRDMLRRMGPSILRIPSTPEPRYLFILGGGSFGLKVLTPDFDERRIDAGVVHDELIREQLEAELASSAKLIRDLGLSAEIGEEGVRALALERLGEVSSSGIWLVRPSPASDVAVYARATTMPILFALLVTARLFSTAALLALWWLIGRDVFGQDGIRLSLGLWTVCALSIVPLRVLDAWAQSRLALDAGAIFKDSLLFGVLNLERADVRGQGVGRFLSTVMEAEVSSTAMESALSVVVSLVELVAALIVLSLGASGEQLGLLLLAWLGLTVWICARYAAYADDWGHTYRRVTHDLVERMVGYQTRLVQERLGDRHREEDVLLHEYLTRSQELDQRALMMDGFLGTAWIIAGIAMLEPVLLSTAQTSASKATALGGILLAANALKQLVAGVIHLVDVGVAWRQTQPILEAGQRAIELGRNRLQAAVRPMRPSSENASLVQFDEVSFKYSENAPPALHRCSQEVRDGDRILLEGPSGGGKSTLGIALAGLRMSDSGTIRLLGQSQVAMPAEHWREQIVLVPQFHDNHILTGSLLFNVLLGRGWPPTAEDVHAATVICQQLGLSSLLEKMPQGISQPVGDGGWTLSHGERSRIFLARALVQPNARLIILDECFAALDSDTLLSSIQCVVESRFAVLAIAHP